MSTLTSTMIADVPIIPTLFGQTMLLQSLALDSFIQSGAVVRDATLDAFLAGEGETFSPRYLGPLADDDPNVSTDDPNVKSDNKKITGRKNTAIRHDLNQSWSVMDLTAMLYGTDPVAAVAGFIAKYWLTVRQRRILASLKGCMASNIADTTAKGDMVNDISKVTGGTVAAANLFSPEAFIDAKMTIGDRIDALRILAVHSVVYSNMLKQDLIDFVKPSDDTLREIPSYQGALVLRDDSITTDSDADGPIYYTYIVGNGAVAMGMGNAKTPFEVFRDPSSGNGGGEERVYSRTTSILHPQGFSWKGATGAGHPTMAELVDAASWERGWERKRIPLACLISRG